MLAYQINIELYAHNEWMLELYSKPMSFWGNQSMEKGVKSALDALQVNVLFNGG